ncbi:MAG: hypothetical protein Q8N51_05710 [Gammaproteobacteria bacterium]|nr:hypothetical protein [Gammaproteobacteria bacterium]
MTTSPSTTSFGNTIGRAVGYSAAALAHGAAVSVNATGRFGRDVVLGTTEGYVEHSERFATLRLAALNGAPMTSPIVPKRAIKVAVKA